MKKFLALLLFPAAALAFYPGGEPDQFFWTPPTERVDGSPLDPYTEIGAYILRCTKDGTPTFNQTIGTGAQNAWQVPQGTFGPGTWVCQLYAQDKEARTSDGSGAVEFLVSEYKFIVAPKAPTGLGVR